MSNIQERIIEVMNAHPYGLHTVRGEFCGCGRWGQSTDEWFATTYRGAEPSTGTYHDHLAEALTTKLGLTEFTCDGQHWWSTKIEPIA